MKKFKHKLFILKRYIQSKTTLLITHLFNFIYNAKFWIDKTNVPFNSEIQSLTLHN